MPRIVTVIIRPRPGLVPAETADYGWEAVLQYEGNTETILATDVADANSKAMAREAELKAE